MDLSLTDAEHDLVDLCREFATKEIAVRAPLARVDQGSGCEAGGGPGSGSSCSSSQRQACC